MGEIKVTSEDLQGARNKNVSIQLAICESITRHTSMKADKLCATTQSRKQKHDSIIMGTFILWTIMIN